MNFCYTNVSILFADDSFSAQQNYIEYLSHLFQNVYMASDGETAWRLYQDHHPDIILLDIEMPILDGLSLARRIRRNDKRTRIVIASGHGSEDRLLQAVELGLTRFLPKPFRRQALKDALAKAVGELDATERIALGQEYLWDMTERKLFYRGEEIKLTAREQALLLLLSSSPKRTLSSYTIESQIWPEAQLETDVTGRLKTLVRRLRKKLPPDCIENVYGEGYRLKLPC